MIPASAFDHWMQPELPTRAQGSVGIPNFVPTHG